MEYPVYYELDFDSFKEHAEFMRLTSHDIIDKAFLSPQETAAMKKIVIEAVKEHNESVDYSQHYQVSLENFGIQYVAYFNKKKEKVIWINGFTKDSPFHRSRDNFYFESSVVDVLDGGNNYFETIIYLTAAKAAGICIHGSS